FYRFPKEVQFRDEWRRICNISKDVKCDYFSICEEHFESKHFLNTSKHKLNWNVIPFENGENCVFSNTQSEISSISEHENTQCKIPPMNINNNTECGTSPSVDVNCNEVTLSTIHNTSCTSQTSYNSSYPALISDFASLYTAELVQKVNNLFDSLNSSCLKPRSNKKYACALSQNSPHFTLWKSMVEELSQWRLIDKRNGKDVTNQYSFIKGWITTIHSIISPINLDKISVNKTIKWKKKCFDVVSFQ
ncbi:hypothetical protein ALC57_14588, partial [Trachymyrmex cornetzi]